MDQNNVPAVDHPQEEAVTERPEEVADSNTRLFRARTVLTYLDTGTFNVKGAKIIFRDAPTPIFDSDDDQIGFASLRNEGDRIEADLTIEYDTEERLLAETESGLYARYFGSMTFGALPLLDLQKPLTVLALRVDGIKLTTHKPTDLRLLPLSPRE